MKFILIALSLLFWTNIFAFSKDEAMINEILASISNEHFKSKKVKFYLVNEQLGKAGEVDHPWPI